MKYQEPKYNITVMETEDVIAASSAQTAKYEVEQNDDGSGNIIMTALDLFR